MSDSDVPIALGSDFNPNVHCLSMPLTMNMACVLFGLSLNQSLVAATINAAGFSLLYHFTQQKRKMIMTN
jgi:imidazolonepropionase